MDMENAVVTAAAQKYKTVVTRIGKNKMTAAALTGKKVNVTTAAVGDGGGAYYLPDDTMTALKGEKWRGRVVAAEIDEKSPNIIHVKLVVPKDVGGFNIRECSVMDADGDMIAVCNMPTVEKAVIEDGTASALTILMHIVVTDADTLCFTIDPTMDTDANIPRTIIVKSRVRDPEKPDYGLGGGGDGGGSIKVALETGPLTGTAEVTAIISGTEYDARNVRTNGEKAPDGTIIINKEEQNHA